MPVTLIENMYIVYVLHDAQGRLYKGMTNNFKRRLAEHRRGKTKTTRQMTALQLVYTEEYSTEAEARKREVYLKTSAGRKFFKKALGKSSN
jgi:putative endonuclease